MAYQRKHTCCRCGGKGKGVTEEWRSVFEKGVPLEHLEKMGCSYCSGKGYVEYNLQPQKYEGNWFPAAWDKLKTEYEDFTARYICECGGEIFFSEADKVVCNCGRVYNLSISLSVDETHLNDMKYWEEYDEKDKTQKEN